MIFIDLDGTLITTEKEEIYPRKGIKEFFKDINVRILSNSSPEHIKFVLDKLDLPVKWLSTYNLHTKFDIKVPDKWVLIDDSPWEECLLKFEKLGFSLREISKDLDNFLNNHYIQIKEDDKLEDIKQLCLSLLQ